jgi:hypothetical protein
MKAACARYRSCRIIRICIGFLKEEELEKKRRGGGHVVPSDPKLAKELLLDLLGFGNAAHTGEDGFQNGNWSAVQRELMSEIGV